MIGDLCNCDLMLTACDEGAGCGFPDAEEEWGQEYDDEEDPTYDDTCCYAQSGPDRCYCAERAEGRPIVTVQPTGGVL